MFDRIFGNPRKALADELKNLIELFSEVKFALAEQPINANEATVNRIVNSIDCCKDLAIVFFASSDWFNTGNQIHTALKSLREIRAKFENPEYFNCQRLDRLHWKMPNSVYDLFDEYGLLGKPGSVA